MSFYKEMLCQRSYNAYQREKITVLREANMDDFDKVHCRTSLMCLNVTKTLNDKNHEKNVI